MATAPRVRSCKTLSISVITTADVPQNVAAAKIDLRQSTPLARRMKKNVRNVAGRKRIILIRLQQHECSRLDRSRCRSFASLYRLLKTSSPPNLSRMAREACQLGKQGA